MKLSTRNIFKGKVLDIDKGKVTAIVRVDIGGGNVVTSSITLASANELALKKGSDHRNNGMQRSIVCVPALRPSKLTFGQNQSPPARTRIEGPQEAVLAGLSNF
jgi:molybdopterin-binding protein